MRVPAPRPPPPPRARPAAAAERGSSPAGRLPAAQVRVMPRCWFVLLRLWLKVDGSMARLRETRLFCRLDTPGE
jgi:hypothetical protein